MSSDSKFFLSIVVIAVLVIGAIVFFSSRQTYTKVESTVGQKQGPDSAKVKIVEFSDFQCPACAAAFPNIEEARAKNSNDVQVIYRHFPLTSIHANTMAAAMAAESAGLQGKFWEMAKLLFENQTSWESLTNPKSAFLTYAKDLNLNTLQFETDLDNPDLKTKIETDSNYATSINITSTPTFFINDKKIIGSRTADEWQKLIDEAKAAN